jgi:hypothetical protein
MSPCVRHSAVRIGAVLCALFLLAGPIEVFAKDQGSEQPPQKVPEASQDNSPGKTLSGRLNSTGGVIHPPSEVDPGAVKPPPQMPPQSTPVVPPPGTPGGDEQVQPK